MLLESELTSVVTVVQTTVSLLHPEPQAEAAPIKPATARRDWTAFMLMGNDVRYCNESGLDGKLMERDEQRWGSRGEDGTRVDDVGKRGILGEEVYLCVGEWANEEGTPRSLALLRNQHIPPANTTSDFSGSFLAVVQRPVPSLTQRQIE